MDRSRRPNAGEGDDPDAGSPLPRVLADHVVLAALWTYWAAQRGDRRMPLADAIDLGALSELAPHLLLVEALDDGGFRYRHVGADLVAAYGFDPTGKRVDDALNAVRRSLARRLYSLVTQSGRPLFARNRYMTSKPAPLVVNRLVLPAQDASGRVNLLVSAQTFDYVGPVDGELGARATLDVSGDTHAFLDDDVG